jgi:hypothetical protein
LCYVIVTSASFRPMPGSSALDALRLKGLTFADKTDLHVYATAGFSFETPTPPRRVPTCRSGGQIAVNFALRAAPSNCVEAGQARRVIPSILH